MLKKYIVFYVVILCWISIDIVFLSSCSKKDDILETSIIETKREIKNNNINANDTRIEISQKPVQILETETKEIVSTITISIDTKEIISETVELTNNEKDMKVKKEDISNVESNDYDNNDIQVVVLLQKQIDVANANGDENCSIQYHLPVIRAEVKEEEIDIAKALDETFEEVLSYYKNKFTEIVNEEKVLISFEKPYINIEEAKISFAYPTILYNDGKESYRFNELHFIYDRAEQCIKELTFDKDDFFKYIKVTILENVEFCEIYSSNNGENYSDLNFKLPKFTGGSILDISVMDSAFELKIKDIMNNEKRCINDHNFFPDEINMKNVHIIRDDELRTEIAYDIIYYSDITGVFMNNTRTIEYDKAKKIVKY